MAEILLLNPKGRTKMKKRRTAAQKRATAKLVAMNRARRKSGTKVRRTVARKATRRRVAVTVAANPAPRRRRAARRSNPAATVRRRRRNPIALGKMGSILAPMKEAAIQGAGAVAFDIGFSYVNRYLPASLQRTPGQVGLGDAVKAVITVVAGQALAKVTKGYSRKAAVGALTIQARDIVASMLPASAGAVAGLGHAVPGRIINASARVNPVRTSLNAYVPGAPTPLLNAYSQSGVSPLLSGRSAAMRESVNYR